MHNENRYHVHRDKYGQKPDVEGYVDAWEVRDSKLFKVLETYYTEGEARRHAEALNGPPSAFHYRDGLYFRRGPEGSVEIVKAGDDATSATLIAIVDANSWCSVVCAASGDYGPGRWEEAHKFHRTAPAA